MQNLLFSILLGLAIIQSLSIVGADECPTIKSFQKVQVQDKYEVQGYLQIPQTNILLINTVSPTFGVSIVYYNDMSAFAGEIISVIKPDYSIIEMVYVSKLDEILLINSAKIILANPYSLVGQQELSIQRSQSLRLVPNTMYAIVTMWYNVINILDITTMKIVKILSNLNKPNTNNMLQKYSQIYKLSDGTQTIMCTNSFGVFSWYVDFESPQLTAQYNDYIPYVDVKYPNSDYFRMIEKHPVEDIFFFNGNSSQIIVLKIQNIQERIYLKMYDEMIFGDEYDGNSFSMIYQEPEIDNVKTPMIVIGELTKYYKLPFILNDDTISFPTIESNSVNIISTYTNKRMFFKLDGNNRFIMTSTHFSTMFHLSKGTENTYLYFLSDGFQRRTIYEGFKDNLYVLSLRNQLYYSWFWNLGDYFEATSRSFFQAYIAPIRNSVCRVKNCEKCLFLRLADSSNDFALTVPIDPIESQAIEIDIQENLNLKWENINVNLDPFYFEESTWVVLSFPYTNFTPSDYLCLLLNASTGDSIELTGDPEDTQSWTSTPTSFALVSIENTLNQEIIAVGTTGKIFVWDLITKVYKYSAILENCSSPEIGSIFHHQAKKWLVVACEDFVVRIYDFQTNQTIEMTELVLYSMPLALNAYSNPGIIVISDFNIGDVHIYKFDEDLNRFSFFITLFKGKFKDTIIGIELIRSNTTLWIQYQLSNLFFELGVCIHDISKCINCTQTTYFKTNETPNIDQTYGNGTVDNPFTGANNYLTAMLKAQMYKDLISIAEQISVVIHVDPSYPMVLRQVLLNSEISSFVSLSIISSDSNKVINLSVQNTLSFSNYYSVSLINSILDFQRTTSSTQCGLQFVSIIEKATLDKIVITQQDCQRIVSQQSTLQISEFEILDSDFTNSGPIFKMYDSEKLDITKLTIKGVTFGMSSSIVSSNNQLILIMTDTIISECSCPNEDVQSNKNLMESVSMFTAGLIQIYGLQIEGNRFCKKNMFTTTSSLVNSYFDFEFFDVTVRNNIFQTVSESIFYTSQFYQRVLPRHSLTFRNAIFEKNSLLDIEDDEKDLRLAHLVMLNKIGTITFDNIKVLNQDGLSLFMSEYSYYIYLNNVLIENDEETRDNTPNELTVGCFNIYEFSELEIAGLTISKKKAIDAPIILTLNNEYENSKFTISKSKFLNLRLIQSQNHLNTSPIMINSPYHIDFILTESTFEDNTLNGQVNSFVYSTSALWISNYIGSIIIEDCSFLRSSSNSYYNYIYIASNNVAIKNSIFSEQSFNEIDYDSIVNGGFINLSTSQVHIFGCQFEKSFAQIGSFLVINSFGSKLNIVMENSSFKEGYALADGSAIYINLYNSILDMKCINLIFENLYTFSDNASVFAFSSQFKEPSHYHSMIFDGGRILNWFGIGDNQFIKFQGMNFTMINIAKITHEQFISSSLAYEYYLDQDYYSQGSLISAKSSLVNIQFCSINDLSYQVDFAVLPLFVSATNSTITLSDFVMENIKFARAGIEIINGDLFIQRSYFNDLKLDAYVFIEDRRLDISESDATYLIEEPSIIESSFIVLHNSTLTITEATAFNNIVCKYDCNGSTIQFLNSSFLITDTQINNSFSIFGGAIFINGMKGDSAIINSSFSSNQAKYSGGAIYFQATTSDKFKLEINNSIFQSNTAILGRGGGIFARSKVESSEFQSIIINGCNINSNIAQVGASLDIQDIIPTIDSSTEIFDNQAFLFGSNMITYPTHLKIRNLEEFLKQANATETSEDISNSDVDLVVNDFQSGSRFPQIEFALVSDSQEEIVPISDEDWLNYSISVKYNSNTLNKERYSIRGTETTQFIDPAFTFIDLELIGIPQSSAILEFSSKQILTIDTLQKKYVNTYKFRVRVNFRNCLPGEETNSYSEFIECTTCIKSYFSFDLKSCQNCRNGADCLGGAKMITNPGYWRKEIYSDDVLLCQNLEKNCVGGEFGNQICYEGHIGALCEECDIYGEYWNGNYAKSGKYSCVNCSDIKYNFVFVALLTIWTLISMTLAIKGDIEYLEHQAAAEALFSTKMTRRLEGPPSQQIRTQLTIVDPSIVKMQSKPKNKRTSQVISVNSAKEQEDKSGIYIKMLTNYIQIVSSIATFNLSIPSGIIDLPSSVGEPLQQTMNSLDCALKDMQRTIPIIYLRLIFSQIIPCFYMLLFVIGLSIKYYFMKKKGKFPTYIISTGFIFLIIYVQPDLVAQTIALISCREIGGTKYILSNVSFECYNEDYSSYTTALVVPLLLVWVIILPGFLFLMLKQNKDNLSSISVKLRYGFLYREYKQSGFYWEFIKMAEKIAIILALNFYSQSIVTKGILVFIVITVYGVTALIKQPYEEEIINQIDVQSTNICAITVLLGIFIYKNDFNYFVYLAFAVIILINAWYLFSMIKKIVSIFLVKFNEPISKFLSLLAKRWPYFEKFIEKVPQKKIPNKKIKRRMQSIVRKFIKLGPKQKKEFCLNIYKEELNEKYIVIEDSLKVEDKLLSLSIEPAPIEMTNSTHRENQMTNNSIDNNIENNSLPKQSYHLKENDIILKLSAENEVNKAAFRGSHSSGFLLKVSNVQQEKQEEQSSILNKFNKNSEQIESSRE